MFTDVIKWHSGDTYIKNVKFKVIKIRKGSQYVRYFNYSANLNWAAQNLRLGRGLDIAGLELSTWNVHDSTFLRYRHDKERRSERKERRKTGSDLTLEESDEHVRARRKAEKEMRREERKRAEIDEDEYRKEKVCKWISVKLANCVFLFHFYCWSKRTFAAQLKDKPNDILTVLLCTVGFLLV